MTRPLLSRLEAVEARMGRVQGRPVVFVKCMSDAEDSPEVKLEREERARAAYIAAHGDPGGVIGVIHRIIITPPGRAGGAHA